MDRGETATEPAQSFVFTYRLWGTGWATMTIRQDEVARDMTISYVGPDINDLVWVAVDFLAGTKFDATIEFNGEEDDHTWGLTRSGNDVRLHIVSDVQVSWDPDSDDDPVIDHWEHEFVMPIRHFGQQVLAAFEAMLSEHGEEGYREKWLHEPYAIKRLSELRALLES